MKNSSLKRIDYKKSLAFAGFFLYNELEITNYIDDEDEAEVVDELLDRFGDIPKETENLIKISKIRAMAGTMGVSEILQQGYKIIFRLCENVKLDEAMMSKLVAVYGGRLMINGGREPYIRLTVNKEEPVKAIEAFLQTALQEKKLN